MKQTSLNLYQMERIRDLNPELVIYGGFDEVYIGARILGADGAIGSTFNFTLPLFNQIEAAYSALDIPKAQALQKRANNIMQALVSCSLFPSIKHILEDAGRGLRRRAESRSRRSPRRRKHTSSASSAENM